ncbi:MAG TPA: tripartite tricarboxylate transporter TctB family protein [Methylomirabilota bacterium]|nr:tripartite tricarboxylate transporter TctB family protein [Methylomirabilota bacterium]
MRRHALPDLSLGLVFLAFGLFIVVQAMGFRDMPSLPVGPKLFPTITGSAMAFFGAILALQAWFGLAEIDDRMVDDSEPQSAEGRWSVPFIPGLLSTIGLAIVAMPWLGFLITGTILTALLVRLGGGGWIAAAVFSPFATLAVYGLFVYGLRVPLPHGLLG